MKRCCKNQVMKYDAKSVFEKLWNTLFIMKMILKENSYHF